MNIIGLIKAIGKVGKWTSKGLKLVPMVGEVVTLVEAIKGIKGRQKQDAAVDLVKLVLAASEEVVDRDVLDDAEVEDATRKVIDAVVALQNVIARKGTG